MNFTNCTAETIANKSKTVTEKMLISLALAVIATLTTLLNSAVIIAICTTKKLHQPANYLICSLAFTDFLVAILVMPLSIAYIVMDTWALGFVICEIWLSVDMTCCTCSILHLCVIALDRYWAITDAIEYARKRTVKRAALMILTVWTISVFISLPPLFWRNHHNLNTPNRIYHAAKSLYQKRGSSRHLSNRSNDSQNSFTHCKLTQTFCVSEFSTSDPTIEFEKMTACVRTPPYDTDADLTADRQQQISSSRERKAARILGLILGAFMLSWLPFFIKELIVGLSLCTVSPEVADFLTWLGYVNSLINPLLYTSFNDDFKIAFKKLIRCKEHS
ncbi:5-hydroxytryptamine receptor 1E isoform X2 [Pyxicephalus adspersus]|uniref:5-hydroxytryptamine receptor 1E isoform X2 n=1 Tax=Pyxicephalus adspersus TaxID=30357 RepID=UPI003B5AE4EC